ncbi:MAG: Gx transporter family protein, partial [Clostridia bacterium]|nr:Gx transporter family protein [Clostridia bacterium]
MKRKTFKEIVKTNGAKRVALSGVMLALALIVSLIENMIPPIVPMLPYAKLGLTNVVLLACFMLVEVWEGYVVLLLKCLLSAVYAGNMSMLIWSLPSALVAYTIMVLLSKTKLFSITGLSVVGGMLHNFTQIVVATLLLGTSVFFYLPYMLLAGGVAGLVTGVICHFAVNGL